ncbi:MAG: glycosyltransferase family 4 protein [Candidatus Omnitrophica bacterium]|nr:glycosyltransferase family 4 protein [Candidatus Omnitrophota bacterium]
MKIGLDIQSLQGNKTGLGVYTQNLLDHLQEKPSNGVQFYFYHTDKGSDLNTPSRLRWENMELPRKARKDRLDLLHIPAFAPPVFKPCKIVVTVHDLIGMICPNQLGWPSRCYWGTWLPQAVRRADFIIADSECTKRDLMGRLRVAEEKIRVIYPSGHEGFSPHVSAESLQALREQFGIPEKYFLCVGTLEPRKNLIRVLKAFAQFLQKKSSDFRLVIVGSKDFAHGEMFKKLLAQTALAPERVIFTGYIPQSHLNALYAGAQALIFPSLYEGFGIPILEAMACGTPVLTSTVSSLPEVAGNAAYLVDPLNTDAIAQGITELSKNEQLRSELRQKGFEQIKRFSWKETARQTLEVYKKLS